MGRGEKDITDETKKLPLPDLHQLSTDINEVRGNIKREELAIDRERVNVIIEKALEETPEEDLTEVYSMLSDTFFITFSENRNSPNKNEAFTRFINTFEKAIKDNETEVGEPLDTEQIANAERRILVLQGEAERLLRQQIPLQYREILMHTDFERLLEHFEDTDIGSMTVFDIIGGFDSLLTVHQNLQSLEDFDYTSLSNMESLLDRFKKNVLLIQKAEADSRTETASYDEFMNDIITLRNIHHSYEIANEVEMQWSDRDTRRDFGIPPVVEQAATYKIIEHGDIPIQISEALRSYSAKAKERIDRYGITYYEKKEEVTDPELREQFQHAIDLRINLLLKNVPLPRVLQYPQVLITNNELTRSVSTNVQVAEEILRRLEAFYKENGIDLVTATPENSEKTIESCKRFLFDYPAYAEVYMRYVRQSTEFHFVKQKIENIRKGVTTDPAEIILVVQELESLAKSEWSVNDNIPERNLFLERSLYAIRDNTVSIEFDPSVSLDTNNPINEDYTRLILKYLGAQMFPFVHLINGIHIQVSEQETELPNGITKQEARENYRIDFAEDIVHEIFEAVFMNLTPNDVKRWVEIIDAIPEDATDKTKWTTFYPRMLDARGETILAYKEEFCEAASYLFSNPVNKNILFHQSREKLSFLVMLTTRFMPFELVTKFLERTYEDIGGFKQVTPEKMREVGSSHMKVPKDTYVGPNAEKGIVGARYIPSKKNITIFLPSYFRD